MDGATLRTARLGSTVAIALIVALGVGGCEEASKAATTVVLPPKKEEELGDKVEKEYLAKPDVHVYQGQMVNSYLRQLGDEAVKAAAEDSPAAIKYEFKVIDDPDQVNAFAMPGGQIFFYTGLLKLAENQSEVMAVMAHEVAHVSKRHIAERLVVTYGLQELTAAAVGDNPGLVKQLVALIVQQGALLTFSRKQESEADKVGFKYMVDAGYDPHGFVTFFEKLKAQQQVQIPKWLSSHPLPQDRIDAAKKRIGDKSYDDKTVGEMTHREIVRAIEMYTGTTGGETGTGGDSDASVDPDPDAGM